MAQLKSPIKGSSLSDNMALFDRQGGSDSPDQWLNPN